jgi:hypothetical protein
MSSCLVDQYDARAKTRGGKFSDGHGLFSVQHSPAFTCSIESGKDMGLVSCLNYEAVRYLKMYLRR